MSEVYSELHFYSLRGDYELSPKKNYVIDSISDFLTSNAALSASLSEYRFIRHQKEDDIRVDIKNINVSSYSLSPTAQAKNFNYVSVRNYIEENDIITYLDPAPIYYFITGKSFVAQQTANYHLEMDVLNTLRLGTDYNFSDKTYITREHEDRWIDDSGAKYKVIDYKNENINPIKFKSAENTILDSNSTDVWYLIVKNTSSIDPDAVAVPLSNPVKLLICSSTAKEVKVAHSFSHELSLGDWAIFLKSDFERLELRLTKLADAPVALRYTDTIIGFGVYDTGTYYKVVTYKQDSGNPDTLIVDSTYNCASVEATSYGSANSITYYIVTTLAPYNAPTSRTTITAGTYTTANLSIKVCISLGARNYDGTFRVDRTNPQLIKIIALPYCPITLYSGNKLPPNATYNDTEAMIEYLPEWGLMRHDIILTGNKSPYYPLEAMSFTPSLTDTKSATRESKLYSSEFYNKKIVYDSFVFDIDLEKVSTLTSFFVFEQVVSGTTASRFMFNISSYNTKLTQFNYNKVLAISRNNELPIYNIAYINYLKTGYNYDLKTKALQAKRDALSLGTQLGGMVMSTALGAMTGGAAAAMTLGMGSINLASSFTNAFYNQIQAQRNIDQKLIESANQGANINSSDDVDLMTDYTDNNKAKLCTYEMTDGMKDLIYKLFFYTGYVQNKYAVPNVTSRAWFNFIQCDPVLKVLNPNIDDDLLDELKEKLRNGVTFFHMNTIASIKRWDLAQEKENWETSLL